VDDIASNSRTVIIAANKLRKQRQHHEISLIGNTGKIGARSQKINQKCIDPAIDANDDARAVIPLTISSRSRKQIL